VQRHFINILYTFFFFLIQQASEIEDDNVGKCVCIFKGTDQ